MNRPTCETCPFWDRFKEEPLPKDGGLCRIGRPAVDKYLAWRSTNKNDWCGEHPDFAHWRHSEEVRKADEFAKKQPVCQHDFGSSLTCLYCGTFRDNYDGIT